MTTDVCLMQMVRRRPADTHVCPLESKYSRTDEETTICKLEKAAWVGSPSEDKEEEEGKEVSGCQMVVPLETGESSEDELGRLDIDLDRKSKQHNLTSSNVRAILHEVITHEHVVAMMKAAIRDTQDQPMFEPKMTRSRLKQATNHSQPLTWSLSAVNTVKPPQFVDIDLEDDEDSSDEEYCPEEEEEEEEDTAEETSNLKQVTDFSRPPPRTLTAPDSSFLERLNAVEEELDCSPAFVYSQCLDRKAADDESGSDEGCLAYRTRSKHPLVNIPLGQLEAELLAPDITADMYEQSTVQWEEDRHWTKWLQGLLDPDNQGQEEADDDDDPEYNFLDDLDEPDREDYRTDKAVQITKKEVNELLDELFDTLQDEEQEEDVAPLPTGRKFNIPKALRFEAPLAGMLTERRRTARKQYEALQQKRALQDTTNHHRDNMQLDAITPVLMLPGLVCPSLHLDSTQKWQLQQQMQQHVQLLTQVHLLCRHLDTLNHEACITKQYLEELLQFSQHQGELLFHSSFRVCNLQAALELLQEVEQRAALVPAPCAPTSYRRWLPTMSPATNSHAFPLLSIDDAWLFATRTVFLYPELLPVCSLDTKRSHRATYTPGENSLIVLALKHFEGTLEPDQLISSYLLRKSRCSIRKHIREMSLPKAPPHNVIKIFLTQSVIPLLPLTCSKVQPGEQRPPVDRITPNSPNWLKNSQLIIQKTRLCSNTYPPSLPPGCNLRLHPHFVNKSRPPNPPHRRFFTLAHNASLLPLAKAPTDRETNRQPISYQSLPSPTVRNTNGPRVPTHPICADIIQTHFPIDLGMQKSVTSQQDCAPAPPLPFLTIAESTSPIMPCAAVKPGYFLFQMMWMPPALPTTSLSSSSHHVPAKHIQRPGREEWISSCPWPPLKEGRQEEVEAESSGSPSTLSPQSEEQEDREEQEKPTTVEFISLNGGENASGEEEERNGGGEEGRGGEDEPSGQGEGEQGGEGHGGEEEGQREDGGGEREEEDREKDKDEDQDQPGEEEEEEEEEDFDDLTQDEDDEEMSSASEESVLSVPELQETMKQLTWLAAEQRLCTDGDSEEEHSPTSPGSQEEEEEDEEEGSKEDEEAGGGTNSREARDEDLPSGEGTNQGGGQCPGRGRGRSRPLRGLRRNRQERHSKDASKLLLLCDDNILDHDPHRESKDMAFAQSYLSRVHDALQDAPEQVEDFVSLLHEFEQVGDGQEVISLFSKLHSILGDRSDLMRDFAAFLHPEQALQCGLFEEQQAFERSRRFLRQLEISFGDNPSHYQKIIKALQSGLDLSPASIHELKTQMAALLKGHTHLQAEFWVFFEELRPPPAHPGQFEEAQWPEDAGGGSDSGEGVAQVCGSGAACGFEEVTLPELDEEEEGHKIQPMANRRQRRKLDAHRNYKHCDWSDKDWPCLCHDAKIRRHRRKGCSHCHGNKTSGGVSKAMRSLDPVYFHLDSAHDEPGDKDLDLKGDSPQPEQSSASWEGSFLLNDEKKEEEELGEEEDMEEKKRGREELPLLTTSPMTTSITSFSSMSLPLCTSSSSPPSRPSPPPDLHVCAKNISLTASGEKVILWTREADRVILTMCQQEGANQNTFQAISSLLSNKSPSEVSRRFQDLMCLFRTAAGHTSSEDETPPTELAAGKDKEGQS